MDATCIVGFFKLSVYSGIGFKLKGVHLKSAYRMVGL